MHPAYRNPFFPALFNLLDESWDNSLAQTDKAYTPAMNIKQHEGGYQVELVMPGMKKENIKVELDKNVLTVSAQNEHSTETQTGKYTRKEFHAASYKRSLNLGENIDGQGIVANYADGILNLTLPLKKDETKVSKVIEIA